MNRRVTTVPRRRLNRQANTRARVRTEVRTSGIMTQPPAFSSCSSVASVDAGVGVASAAWANSGVIRRANQFIPVSSLFKCTSWRSANAFAPVPPASARRAPGELVRNAFGFEFWVLSFGFCARAERRLLPTQNSKLFSRWSFRLRERNVAPYGGGFPWRKARSEQEVARRSA